MTIIIYGPTCIYNVAQLVLGFPRFCCFDVMTDIKVVYIT